MKMTWMKIQMKRVIMMMTLLKLMKQLPVNMRLPSLKSVENTSTWVAEVGRLARLSATRLLRNALILWV